MARMLTTVEVGAMADPPVTRFTVVREIRRGHLRAEEPEGGGYWQIDPKEAARWVQSFIPYRMQWERSQRATERARLRQRSGPDAAGTRPSLRRGTAA